MPVLMSNQPAVSLVLVRYSLSLVTVSSCDNAYFPDIRCCGFLQDVFYAMATLGDDPAVVKVCHQCLRQLSTSCPLLDIGVEEGIDRVDKMPIHLIMVPLMLHPDNVELCLEACQTVVAVSSDCETMQKVCMLDVVASIIWLLKGEVQ